MHGLFTLQILFFFLLHSFAFDTNNMTQYSWCSTFCRVRKCQQHIYPKVSLSDTSLFLLVNMWTLCHLPGEDNFHVVLNMKKKKKRISLHRHHDIILCILHTHNGILALCDFKHTCKVLSSWAPTDRTENTVI